MMKKFDCVKSFTAALVAALVLIVAGAFVLGFVGFNKDVKYTDHYEVKITAEENFGDNNKTMKDTAEAVFKEDGLRYVYREEISVQKRRSRRIDRRSAGKAGNGVRQLHGGGDGE